MADVQIINLNINSLEELHYEVNRVSGCIGTWLLPTEELSYSSLRDLLDAWNQINLGRSFSDSGFSEAIMYIQMDNHSLEMTYVSTSGTSVVICISLNEMQNPQKIQLEVSLPEDRAQPGRIHYEELTRSFYNRRDFKEVFDGIKDDLGLPCENLELPLPEWIEKEQFENM